MTTQLTPAAQKIRLTANPEVIRGCTFVGNVQGSDRFNGGVVGEMAADENAARRMQNAAGPLGADVILLSGQRTGLGGSRAQGEAYRCSPTPLTEAECAANDHIEQVADQTIASVYIKRAPGCAVRECRYMRVMRAADAIRRCREDIAKNPEGLGRST